MIGIAMVVIEEEKKRDMGYEIIIATTGGNIHRLYADTEEEADKMVKDCVGNKGWFEVDNGKGHKLAIRRSAVEFAGYKRRV